MPPLPVSPSEIDPKKHDHYLDVIANGSERLGQSMLHMGTAAGAALRSENSTDFADAVEAMTEVSGRAAIFLGQLAATPCPTYLRGADDQIQDALKLLVDGGKRGADAAASGDGKGLRAAAAEMEVANEGIVEGARRIGDWRRGAARP